MGLETQGSKPSGFIGKVIGRMMNTFHTNSYKTYINERLPSDNSVILDIGCGGGKFIKFLSSINKTYKVYGIDHSEEMVKLSIKINKKAVLNKQVKILNTSVSSIPIKEKTDLVTAFETIQFWLDIDKSLSEIARIMNPGAKFIVINRYPPEGSKWYDMVKIKNTDEYKTKLSNAGFSKISVDLNYKSGWICIESVR